MSRGHLCSCRHVDRLAAYDLLCTSTCTVTEVRSGSVNSSYPGAWPSVARITEVATQPATYDTCR